MIQAFKKNVLAGESKLGKVFLQIDYTIKDKKGRLSITGVQGPLGNGDCRGSCGQCIDVLHNEMTAPASGIDVAKLADIWKRWHLNDMRPYCEHQRAWPFGETLEVQAYTTTEKADDLATLMRLGRATPEEADLHALTEKIYHMLTVGSSENYPADDIARLLAAGTLKPWKVESKLAGWVYPYSHPRGLLGRQCPTCGYHYGSAWRYEEVPEDVLEYLRALPESNAMPSIWAK